MAELYGNYYIKPTASALVRAWKLCNGNAKDFYRLRSHALKLAYWPDQVDLDWDWIKSLEAKRVGELRIGERIAGHDNIRIIFFKANKVLLGDPSMPRIWTLHVFQKKRNDFSGGQIAAFRAMRDIIVERHYANLPGA